MPRGGHARVGRLPDPNSSRTLLGKNKAKTVAARRSQAIGPVPDPPDTLTEAELLIWREYAPLLAVDGRLNAKSRDVLARYCTAVVRVRVLKVELAQSSSIIISTQVDSAGNERMIVKANPLDNLLRNWMQAARALENDLLLNPAAALRAPEPKAEPDLDEFADEGSVS